MNMCGWALVIFLTFTVVPLGVAWWMGRHPPVPQAGPAPLPGGRPPLCPCGNTDVRTCERFLCAAPVPLDDLPRAGRFDVEYLPGPPFASATRDGYDRVDTGPLLLPSEKAAANAALEREIRQLGDEAERKIGPVQ